MSKLVYFRERLRERDRDLIDYLDGLGLVTTTDNCVLQATFKAVGGFRKQNVHKQDDSLATSKTDPE